MNSLNTLYEERALSKDEREWSNQMIEMMMTARKHVRINKLDRDVSEDVEDKYDI